MSEGSRRGAFVLREILKNLAMGFSAVRAIRGSRTRRSNAREAIAAAVAMWDFYSKQMKRLGLSADFVGGKRVLEIGPGATLLTPLWFLAMGARHVEGVDRFMDLQAPNELAGLNSLAAESWPPEMRARVQDVLAWVPPGKEGDRLRYRQFPVEAPPDSPDGSFDLMVSFNTLEHVDDVRATMQSLYRLLAPGGLMIHRINCGTHGEAATFAAGYLNQLTFSRPLWRLMYSNRGGTNQEPMGAFVRACELAGFNNIQVEVLERISDEEVKRLRPLLHPDFRGRQTQDLTVLSFALTATKL